MVVCGSSYNKNVCVSLVEADELFDSNQSQITSHHWTRQDATDTYLSVHLRQQLQQLLLRLCGEGREGPHIDEGSDVCVDQDGAWRFKIYIHPSSIPLHGPCKMKTTGLNSTSFTAM